MESKEELLIKYGYMSDQLPPVLNTNKLLASYSELKNIPQRKPCESTSFTIAKNDQTRRRIKIPNPAKQVPLIKYIIENETDLESTFSNNKHSLSNPFYYTTKMYDDLILFDVPLFREEKPYLLKSNFISNLDKKMNVSMGFRYAYKIDLANFYDSIYTHSIEWAVVGREESKRNIGKSKENLGWNLDKLIRGTNSNETSGIPTGPFTSRIISELVLVKINEELEELSVANNDVFTFVHYVDDYEFYFRNEHDIHLVKNKIVEIFEAYRLKINENKTIIIQYPYHTIVDLKGEYEYYIKQYRETNSNHYIRLLFFKADEFVDNGIKGAYKYLYKMLYNKVDLTECWKIIEPFLIGHLLIQPSISQYIVELILKYEFGVSERLRKELFNNLCISIDNHLHNESQWLLWSLIKVEYPFSSKDLMYLYDKSDDDITKIMTIALIYKLKKDKGLKILRLLENEIDVLTTLNFESDRWLIIHEWYMNSWEGYKKLEPLYSGNSFFQVMKRNKVTFLEFDL